MVDERQAGQWVGCQPGQITHLAEGTASKAGEFGSVKAIQIQLVVDPLHGVSSGAQVSPLLPDARTGRCSDFLLTKQAISIKFYFDNHLNRKLSK